MNIDDLKDAWNKDEPSGMHLPVSTAALRDTTSAIAKIRRNMKKEFIATLISYLAMFGFLFFYQQNAFFFATASVLIFTLMIPNAYYFFKFYVFYKSIGYYDLNVKNSIRKVAYELELNIELYKAYNLCVTPLAVMITFGLVCGKKTFDLIQRILSGSVTVSPGMMILVFSIILISFAIIYVCINLSVRSLYGKYLAGLKKVVDDLERED
ncbi:hypothetical protein ACPPVU_01670 [Mucilaginibacter sp. McL0603]|uniref:hypothetical protein n=1 Tax=Mucilaginibacter sp. McL0603 TaxID=3415670 RepID=UPI003CE7D8EF